jgi:hypothetical protein
MSALELTTLVNGDNIKLITTKLDNDVNEKMQTIADSFKPQAQNCTNSIIAGIRKIFGNKKISEGMRYYYSFTANSITYPSDLYHIKTLASTLLTHSGFKINPDICKIEMYFYDIKEGEKGTTVFAPHMDDDSHRSITVETCIFYIQKDKTLIGGNLDYYIPNEQHKLKWYNKIFENYGDKHELNTTTGTVALMSGNMYHCPQDYSGHGKRNCIVVQFKSLERTIPLW